MDRTNYKGSCHFRITFIDMVMRTLMALVLSIILLSCSSSVEIVNIDETYWSAYRNPESFDTYLQAQTLDPRSSNCFMQFSNAALTQEDAKLLECSVILQGSPAWNECHEEAEALHNQAVIMNDIASAIDGPMRFDESEAYAFLIIAKSIITETDWNALIDVLDEVTPPFQCEYEGDDEWFWE